MDVSQHCDEPRTALYCCALEVVLTRASINHVSCVLRYAGFTRHHHACTEDTQCCSGLCLRVRNTTTPTSVCEYHKVMVE